MWNNEKCILLITLYENERVLWDPRDETYCNRNVKQDAWGRLAESIGEEIDEVKKKINNLLGLSLRSHSKVISRSKFPHNYFCFCIEVLPINVVAFFLFNQIIYYNKRCSSKSFVRCHGLSCVVRCKMADRNRHRNKSAVKTIRRHFDFAARPEARRLGLLPRVVLLFTRGSLGPRRAWRGC